MSVNAVCVFATTANVQNAYGQPSLKGRTRKMLTDNETADAEDELYKRFKYFSPEDARRTVDNILTRAARSRRVTNIQMLNHGRIMLS